MLNIVNLRKNVPEIRANLLGPWIHGTTTSVSRGVILGTELADCVNWYVSSSKALVPTPAVIKAFDYQFSGDIRGMYVDADGTFWVAVGNKVYKWSGTTFVENGTLDTNSGRVYFYRFSDKLFVLDGSYIKFVYGNTVRIGYDCGSGSRAYIYNTENVGTSSYNAIGSGSNLFARFTAPNWPSYLGSLPIVRVSFYLKASGAGLSGPIYCRVYKGTYMLREKLIVDASKLPTDSPAKYTVSFDIDLSIGFTTGDTFYVGVYNGANQAISIYGSGSGESYRYTGSSWSTVSGFTINCTVSSNLPPKANFATTWLGRPWLGGDPDNPGRLWFGNIGMFDFSTPLGGGWLGIGDDGSGSWKVGGLTSWFGDLYVMGKPEFPYLVRIKGTEIDKIQQQVIFRNMSCKSQDHLIMSFNDLFLSDSKQVWSLSMVRDYGDLRSASVSEPISDFVSENNIRSSLYIPNMGINIYSLENTSRIAIQSLQAATYSPDRDYGPIRTPWSFWQIYREDLLDSTKYEWHEYSQHVYYLKVKEGVSPIERPDFVVVDWADIKSVQSINDLTYNTFWYGQGANLPYDTVFIKLSDVPQNHYMVRTALSPVLMYEIAGQVYFVCSDRRIYKIDHSGTKDMGIVTRLPMIHTGNDMQASRAVVLRWIKPIVSSDGGGSARIVVYRGNFVASPSYKANLSVSDLVRVQDLVIPISEADFSVSGGTRDPMLRRVAIHTESYSVRLFVETQAKNMSLKGIAVGTQSLRY